MQYVRVEVDEGRAYTYTWDGTPPLKRGDVVVLPSNIVQEREFTGRVLRTMTKPDTDFPLKAVLRRATRKAAPKIRPEDEDLL